jgi:hypothetical protein
MVCAECNKGSNTESSAECTFVQHGLIDWSPKAKITGVKTGEFGFDRLSNALDSLEQNLS